MEANDLMNDARANLERLIRKSGDDFSSVSRMLGKNPAYIQQYIKRGTPKKLDEEDRRRLAEFYGVDERLLGAPALGGHKNAFAPSNDLIPIQQLQIGASAGPGSLADEGEPMGAMAFGPAWFKQLGVNPDKVSLITVDGDSMYPALGDGDDIMVDHSAAERSLRDGIYVLRMDDVLLVKRIAIRPAGKLSIRSDNPQYPNWDDVDTSGVNIIGRVVWTGRRL